LAATSEELRPEGAGCDADWFGVENVVAVGVMRNELSLVWT